MSWWIISSIVGLVITAIGGGVAVFFKRYENNTRDAAVGKVATELAKQEAQDVRTAAEELVKHVDTSDTVKTLKDGKF